LKLKRSLDGAGRTALGSLAEYVEGRRAWPPWESVRGLIEATEHGCAMCANRAVRSRALMNSSTAV
jgi:hypothetical protein